MTLKLIVKPSLLLCVILLFISVIQCFPPGVHKIDLHDSGVFVISSYNDYDDDEEEMIQPEDIKHMAALAGDEEKYEPLHTFVAQFNKQIIRPPVKIKKGLNKLSEGRFRVRALKSKPSIKQKKHKNSKRYSDDDDRDNDNDEKDDDDYDLYQTTIDDDDMKDINETIWDETSTTEQKTSTTEDLYDLDSSSKEYQSPSTYFTDVGSSSTMYFSTTTTEIDDYYEKSTPTSHYSTKYDETTESQDETSEWLSVVETSSLSTKIYDNETSSTHTTIQSTESEGETITKNNASSPSQHYTMTRTSESSTSESTYHTGESSAAPHRESTRRSVETEPHRYTDENPKTSDKETTTEVFAQEKTKHRASAKNVTLDVHERTTKMIKLPTRKHFTKPITTAETTEETEVTEPMEYEKIMPEYGAEIEELKTDKFTYNFTDDEIEKSLKKIVKKTLNFRKPTNCSEFKGWKYGVQAIECAIGDYKDAKNHNAAKIALGRSWKIIRVWLILYVCIAVPCWCQNGWCCCCCRCKICFPVNIIRTEKKYFALNPPGTLVDPSKPTAQPVTYEPTVFEEDVYQEFESAIRNL